MAFLSDKVKRAATWYLDRLPSWLLLPGWRHSWVKIVLIEEFPIDLAKSTSGLRQGARIAIKMSGSTVLIRKVTVPKSGWKHASGILDLDVRRALPDAQNTMIWRSQIRARSRTDRVYTQVVVRKLQIEQVAKKALDLGFRLSHISADEIPSEPLIDNRSVCNRPIRFWWLGTLSAVILGLAVLFGAQFLHMAAENTALTEVRTTQLKLASEAADARSAALKSSAKLAAIEADILVYNERAQVIELLAQLTETIPETAWVSEMSLAGNGLRLSGFTKSSLPELLKDLQKVGWILSIELDGPTSHDLVSGSTRFELKGQLARREIVQ